MTRREFSAALAGVAASLGFLSGDASPVVVLKAIACARLPETLAIKISCPEKMREGVWELRIYQGAASTLASRFDEVFPRAGIRPWLGAASGSDLAYLIQFENLTARDLAWTAVNADPAWIRARTQFQSYHFGLYRAL